MASQSSLKDLPKGSFGDNKEAISFLLSRTENEHQKLAEEYLPYLFGKAADPIAATSSQACSNLCYFVDQCRKSKSSVLKDFSYSACPKLFDFYLEWCERHHQKAMRQVLDLTASLLCSNPDTSALAAIKASVLACIAALISPRASQTRVKPAFRALEVFLAKKSVSRREVLDSYLLVVPKAKDYDGLVVDVFYWMRCSDVSPAAGKFLVALFTDLQKTYANSSSPGLWQIWILKGLQEYPESLDNMKNHLFPSLFIQNRSGSLEFLQLLTQQADFSSDVLQHLDTSATLLLAAMEAGKKLGLVEDQNTEQQLMSRPSKRDKMPLPETAIGGLLSHTSISIRSAALSVLVTSTVNTRPFSMKTLEVLRKSLAFLHADTDAYFRNNLLSSTKNMLYRLYGVIRHLFTLVPVLGNVGEEEDNMRRAVLESHIEFKDWYLDFMEEELAPTASYQRHITALRAIMSWPAMNLPNRICSYDYSRPIESNFQITRLVLDLVADPFEEVRICAAQILRSIGTTPGTDKKSRETAFANNPSLDPKIVFEFISRVERASRRTGRADMADGLARAQELYCSLTATAADGSGQAYLSGMVSNLEDSISTAQTNLASAVRGSPVHGQFASLGLLVDRLSSDALGSAETDEHGESLSKRRWEGIAQRLFECCQNMWERVEAVLCTDSPEGHLPPDFIADFEDIDTKELLSYSFRAIHESSNLMRALVSKMNLQFADGSPFLDQKQFEAIGNLSFKQLAALRHRGAFSTVSLTFAKCCQQTQSLRTLEKSTIINEWYRESLSCIFDQVSTTRRSAGIPALITGILSAHAESPSFESVMKELQKVASRAVQLSDTDETNLPQVHAMNSMKEIYKSSVLSKKSEMYIAVGFQLAARSLQSDIWAIRNCGLLLLRSLIDRMFGTTDSKAITDAGWDGLSIRLSYDKYQGLPELLVKLLDVQICSLSGSSELNDRAVQTVFPALDIIRRAGPPGQYRDQIYDLVSRHLSSRLWHVRDIAARTMCTMINNDWVESAIELLQSCGESSNRCHGVLMTLRHVLERSQTLEVPLDNLRSFVFHVNALQHTHAIFQGSPDVRAAYIDVATGIVHNPLFWQDNGNVKSWRDHLQSLQQYSHILACENLLDWSAAETSRIHEGNKGNSALLRKSCGLYTVLSRARERDWHMLDLFVGAIVEKDPDTLCEMLTAIPSTWFGAAIPVTTGNLQPLAFLHVEVLLRRTSTQVKSVAARNLATILDKMIYLGSFGPQAEFKPKYEVLFTTSSEQFMLPIDRNLGSPELSNALIRLSGSAFAQWLMRIGDDPQSSERAQLEKKLLDWGSELRELGQANNDFETRYAAIEALEAFFKPLQLPRIKTMDALIPSLLAIYDALVDDDDEVRDVAARLISNLFGGSLVPLAAQEKFFPWLEENFGKEKSTLCDTTLERLTGGQVESVNSQLSRAMKEDDTLFIEEEQNLFTDEVRETSNWAKILLSAKGPAWKDVIATLSSWFIDGLEAIRLAAVAERKDGPLGWSSSPQVFAICMRTFLTGIALLSMSDRELAADVRGAMIDGFAALQDVVGSREYGFHLTLKGYVDLGSVLDEAGE